MAIRVRCSSCNKPLKVADTLAGRRIRCPGCQTVLRVPPSEMPAETPPGRAPSSSTSSIPAPNASPGSSTKPDDPTDWLFDGTETLTGEESQTDSNQSTSPATRPKAVPPSLPRKTPRTVARSVSQTGEPSRVSATRAIGGKGANGIRWQDHLLWVLLLALVPR